jgi:uncharacterized protein YndB with AHSA1/START domain
VYDVDGWRDFVVVNTLVLTETDDGRTLATIVSEYPSSEARDAHLEPGMVAGMNEGFERLDELLARLQAEAPRHA